jgi:hypothetical protein
VKTKLSGFACFFILNEMAIPNIAKIIILIDKEYRDKVRNNKKTLYCYFLI